ncbi:MAG: hypothetical protein E7514_03195 [Ruminococcaceae bacterium]|nr:hypothetical protein [Oscillospiraceae bacterium]
MRKSKRIDFSNRNIKKAKRVRTFIIAFAAFVIVLGSVSLLIFMKDLNFDLKNLVSKKETTTVAEETTTAVEPVELEGTTKLITAIANAEGKLTSVYAVITDFEKKEIKVYSIPVSTVGSYDTISGTLVEIYDKYGILGLKRAAEGVYGVSFNRYIASSEPIFRGLLAKLDDVTVELDEPLDGSTSDGLVLDKGRQSLTPEMYVKYLNLCPESKKAETFAALLQVIISENNSDNLSNQFTFIANNTQTDITIIDYSNEEKKIKGFISSEGKIIPEADTDKLNGVKDEK